MPLWAVQPLTSWAQRQVTATQQRHSRPHTHLMCGSQFPCLRSFPDNWKRRRHWNKKGVEWVELEAGCVVEAGAADPCKPGLHLLFKLALELGADN